MNSQADVDKLWSAWRSARIEANAYLTEYKETGEQEHYDWYSAANQRAFDAYRKAESEQYILDCFNLSDEGLSTYDA